MSVQAPRGGDDTARLLPSALHVMGVTPSLGPATGAALAAGSGSISMGACEEDPNSDMGMDMDTDRGARPNITPRLKPLGLTS